VNDGTEAAAGAGDREEDLAPAGVIADRAKALAEITAIFEGVDLLVDEAAPATAVGPVVSNGAGS
jgi:hypothetical protein